MSTNDSQRFPSQEMPWLKWLAPNARQEATKPVENITMCQLIERSLREQGDTYPAINYFGAKISRSKFLSIIDKWARMFYKMGVRIDERVIMFVPFTPESGAIMLALNKIGACAVMLNLGSSIEALRKGSEGARFAVVADAVENLIAPVFRNNPTLEHVIFLSVNTDMPFPLKQVMSLKSAKSTKEILRSARNYITSKEALNRWSGYIGPVEAPCNTERVALVTSSGGTSAKGYAKQIMDSNRAFVALVRESNYNVLAKTFIEGTTCYASLPPFISTSTLVLFMLPLYYNMTCLMDPRVDPVVLTNNILKHHTSVCFATGPGWVHFFKEIERRIESGNTPDLSFMNMPIMGGDGISVKDFRRMNSLLSKCGSKVGIFSGYGMSEMFSFVSVDCREGYASDNDKESVISVGNPIPGADIAIMDKEGNELTYGQRGEVCVKGSTIMLGYYKDIERTNAVLRDGWFMSGDLGSIDEDGNLFIYGRLSDCFENEDGTLYHPSDIEYLINKDVDVMSSLVVNVADNKENPHFAAHIVLSPNCREKDLAIRRIDKAVHESLSFPTRIEGYKTYSEFFKMTAATKVDRTFYKNQLSGYVRPDGDKMVEVTFS